ncbi:hypothetical protein ACPOL_3194 [Acidisarcina polymorpha]|uniref:DUF2306 domain-containing protein n=1 Tax=Acidisarcina polymorpha TaxID=2211140 RepID=A0A2Z5G0C8_9BACT|nr:DUF2306 domain-containing protein [Acidisarcina polymorpha]AXC12489.1 hypothetical protein ACPOL_3194 [Acidisarcina polymorpha]
MTTNMGTMDRRPWAMTRRLTRTSAFGILALLYGFGVFVSTRASILLLKGKESGPNGHPYPPWTIIHFASALLFAVLAMMQLVSVVRRRYPLLHRYSGRIAVVSGLIAAITGVCIPFAVVPPRPLLERLYIVVYFGGVASCLLLGLRAARRHDFAMHRIWMIRAVAAAGAVMTQRITFPIFVLTFGIHSERAFWSEFVGAFALGWAINLTLAECWLRWTPSAGPYVV